MRCTRELHRIPSYCQHASGHRLQCRYRRPCDAEGISRTATAGYPHILFCNRLPSRVLATVFFLSGKLSKAPIDSTALTANLLFALFFASLLSFACACFSSCLRSWLLRCRFHAELDTAAFSPRLLCLCCACLFCTVCSAFLSVRGTPPH